MFNLPNNTPYIIIIEADTGYMVMSSRWIDTGEGELGPVTTFACYNEKIEALSAAETFMDHDETD